MGDVQVFQDVLGIANFTSSEEAFAADALFLAYKEGNADKIKAVVQVRMRGATNSCIQERTCLAAVLGTGLQLIVFCSMGMVCAVKTAFCTKI